MAFSPELVFSKKGTGLTIYFNKSGTTYAEGNYIESSNGKYRFFAGNYYSESSDTDPDMVILLQNNEILFKKKLSEFLLGDCSEFCGVSDDGCCFYCTEEDHLVFLGPDGKQQAKKTIPGLSVNAREHIGIADGILYSLGQNDDGESVLYIVTLENKTVEHFSLPDYADAQGHDLGNTADEADLYYHDRRFTLAYRDGKTCLTVDTSGTISEPIPAERAKAFEIQAARLYKEKMEEEKRRADQAKYNARLDVKAKKLFKKLKDMF